MRSNALRVQARLGAQHPVVRSPDAQHRRQWKAIEPRVVPASAIAELVVLHNDRSERALLARRDSQRLEVQECAARDSFVSAV